jgi:dUTP pyrophosphatase
MSYDPRDTQPEIVANSLASPTVEYVLDDPDALDPVYGSKGAAGMDLRACTEGEIEPGEQAMVDTGVIFAIPPNWEGHVRSRSGLTINFKTDLPTGTIDSDYRGRVKMVIRNNKMVSFKYRRGDKLAQMIVSPAPQARLVKKARKEDLSSTERGANGFGSTGVSTETVQKQ